MLSTARAFLARKIPWWVVRATQPSFLVSVVALLRAPDGRILLLENRFWRGNRWGCPSGYMHRDESPEQTAVRECVEECGVRPRDLRIVRVLSQSSHRLEIWCTGTVDIADAPRTLQRREITGAALLAPDDAVARMRRSQAVMVRRLLTEAESARGLG